MLRFCPSVTTYKIGTPAIYHDLMYTLKYTMVFFEVSQLSILKIPHFHVSSVDFVDCLIVYNLWGKGNLRLRDFCRAGCEFEKRREVRGDWLG